MMRGHHGVIAAASAGGAPPALTLPTTDLYIWWDPELNASESGGAGTGVSDMADQSGSGIDASQPAPSNRPGLVSAYAGLGGLKALSFASANAEHMVFSPSGAAGDYTLYAVIDQGALSGFPRLMQNATVTHAWRAHNSGNVTYVCGGVSLAAPAVTGPQVLTVVLSTSDDHGRLYRGNTLLHTHGTYAGVALTGTTGIGGTHVGSATWDGHLGAFYVYQAAHSDAQRAAVLAYIAQERGL